MKFEFLLIITALLIAIAAAASGILVAAVASLPFVIGALYHQDRRFKRELD